MAFSKTHSSSPALVKLTGEEVRARQRNNIYIALGLLGFVLLVFFVTVSRLQSNIEQHNENQKTIEQAPISIPETRL